MKDQIFMLEALKHAQKAYVADEVPIGAIITSPEGKIIAADHNRVERDQDPSAHAELMVIREASRIVGTPRLVDHTLYTTLEPCPMCAQLIAFARIKTLYIGAKDQKGGGVFQGPKIFDQPTCHHKITIHQGVEEEACSQILKSFFKEKRALKK
jgi:tRNA(adenine34) deaminase